jgi:dephospho-CoA kinase
MKKSSQIDSVSVPKDTLVFMVGRPSSGKTFFARQFAPYVTNGVLIDKDTGINDPLITPDYSGRGEVEGKLFSTNESLGEYQRKNREREKAFLSLAQNLQSGEKLTHDSNIYKTIRFTSYLTMQALARDNLQVGKCPILIAPHIKESTMGTTYFKDIPEMLLGRAVRTKLIVCTASEETIFKRMNSRGNEQDDYMAAWESFQKDLKREPIFPDKVKNWDYLEINTDEKAQNPLENIKNTLEFLLN